MRINFFEEYPTAGNLAKLGMITWPTTIFIACASLDEFDRIIAQYRHKYPLIEFGWWPVIPGSYWISGFANPASIEHLFRSFGGKPLKHELPILLDLELPRKVLPYIKNVWHLRSNRRRISRFIAAAPKHKLRVYTAEYPASSRTIHALSGRLGLSPDFSLPHTKIPMCYSSIVRKYFGKRTWIKIKGYTVKLIQAHPHSVSPGLGVTATGVFGNEPTLAPNGLAGDLAWAQENGAQEVFIFRLGGLDQSYLSVLRKYAGIADSNPK